MIVPEGALEDDGRPPCHGTQSLCVFNIRLGVAPYVKTGPGGAGVLESFNQNMQAFVRSDRSDVSETHTVAVRGIPQRGMVDPVRNDHKPRCRHVARPERQQK